MLFLPSFASAMSWCGKWKIFVFRDIRLHLSCLVQDHVEGDCCTFRWSPVYFVQRIWHARRVCIKQFERNKNLWAWVFWRRDTEFWNYFVAGEQIVFMHHSVLFATDSKSKPTRSAWRMYQSEKENRGKLLDIDLWKSDWVELKRPKCLFSLWIWAGQLFLLLRSLWQTLLLSLPLFFHV